ncbi:hypothetical protein B0H94_1083 [Salsuginibacillus halophilus]|uniref:Uncharacterized protein n=1 Tax=Salsuginibacillus halophilus TaxID=517424 RepID=A0A2P8HDU4_9BACI|nr:hypothetical protein B0H94_1083 [Salsuginibacillus halophilus]
MVSWLYPVVLMLLAANAFRYVMPLLDGEDIASSLIMLGLSFAVAVFVVDSWIRNKKRTKKG